MAVKTLAELKAYFETGDKPTQAEFEDLLDTMFSIASGMKMYNCKLTEVGGVLTVTVINNQLGFTPTVEQQFPGQITFNSAGGLFQPGKVQIFVDGILQHPVSNVIGKVSGRWMSDYYLAVETFDMEHNFIGNFLSDHDVLILLKP